jgi:hypothetical protein
MATQPTKMTEQVFAARATMADGATVDLLLFAQQSAAAEYAKALHPLPLGFDAIEVIERQIIGTVSEPVRRAA